MRLRSSNEKLITCLELSHSHIPLFPSLHSSFCDSDLHLFIHPPISAFIHLSIHSFLHSFTHPSIHSSIHSFIYSSIHLFIHSCIHPFNLFELLSFILHGIIALYFIPPIICFSLNLTLFCYRLCSIRIDSCSTFIFIQTFISLL